MATPFDELKRYVRWTDSDSEQVAGLRPLVEPHFSRIAQEFYDRIREHERAHDVLADEAQIARLQRTLKGWMNRLFGGVYDDAYFEQTAAIGRAHVRVGLPQRYVFTAVAQIRSSFHALVSSTPGADALGRLLDLELAIMAGTYLDHMSARVDNAERVARETMASDAARRAVQQEEALELARVFVIGLDAGGRVVRFNREAERITGYAADEAMGQPARSLFPPVGHASDVEARLNEAAGREAFEDLVLQTRAKKLCDVRFRSVRVDDGDVALLAAGIDVTQESRRRERAHQQERLAAVGTLAAGLAHEIRNPLNGALLHAAFLERTLRRHDVEPDAIEAIDTVSGEIKRLALLVTEFLDFARPSPLTLATISARALFDRTVPLLSGAAADSGVHVSTELPADGLSFVGDRNKLEQVLLNIGQNGIEASTSGGTVILRAWREPRHAVFEVEDDGVGFPATDAPIFDAFYSTKASGTGLGLTIAHRIVTNHQGTIDVDRRAGRTYFRVRLPVAGPRVFDEPSGGVGG